MAQAQHHGKPDQAWERGCLLGVYDFQGLSDVSGRHDLSYFSNGFPSMFIEKALSMLPSIAILFLGVLICTLVKET